MKFLNASNRPINVHAEAFTLHNLAFRSRLRVRRNPDPYLAVNVPVRVSWIQFSHQAVYKLTGQNKRSQYGFDCEFGTEMRSTADCSLYGQR